MIIGFTEKRIANLLKKFGNSEGIYTKVVTSENQHDYKDIMVHLEANEIPLIVCRFHATDWTLLTTKRILSMNLEGLRAMNHTELLSYDFDVQGEIANGAKKPTDFTRIILTDINKKTFTLNLEPGYPFGGISAALTFILGLFPKEE